HPNPPPLAGEGVHRASTSNPPPQAAEGRVGADGGEVPTLIEIVATLGTASRAAVGAHLAPWLDGLDATGRWALLKLVTGSLRIGVSARLAKLALAQWSGAEIAQIEEVWHALAPPYPALFDWLEGRTAAPLTGELPTF